MKRPAGQLVLTVMMCVFLAIPLSASVPVLNNSNDLLAATIPVTYGEHAFRERILTQTEGKRDPVGLVLSGGSARAFAHLGVLELLEEEGIVPDFIISNSMGSIVGILYAAGLSPQQIRSIITNVDITQLFDLSVPLKGGFLDISRFLSVVAAYLGPDLQIEELPIPIMIVCEDLATKRQVRIMEGDLLTVLGAAFALPVYFSPVQFKGHLLVDGGITNLVPLEIAYSYTDTAIVSTTFYDAKGINLRNPLAILNVSIDIGKRRLGIGEVLDHQEAVWIRCDVENFSFMDFGAIEELAQKGYASASQHRERLAALDSRGLTTRMHELRDTYSQREREVGRAFNLFQRTEQLGFSQQVFFGIRTFNPLKDRWYLRDEVLAGLMYQLRRRGLWFSLYGGAAWESFSPMSIYPGIHLRLSHQPISPLVLEAELTVSNDEGYPVPTLYHRLGFQFRQRLFDGRFTATALGWWEQQLDPDFSLDAMLVHGGIDLGWKPKRPDLPSMALEAGWQLAGDWDRQFLHTRFDTTIVLPADLRLHLGYTGRYALDGMGSVPIYLSDGFKTAEAGLRAQGSPGAPVRDAQMMIVGRLGFDWQPGAFKPTAGELLIFEHSAVGLFTDLLWNEEDSFLPAFVAGAKVSTTVSLLGLNSMPTSVYVGYDSPAESIVWGFVFGR